MIFASWCSLLCFNSYSYESIIKSACWEATHLFLSVLFFLFSSHEVVASVANSLYLFFVPLLHWKCEVLFCCPETDFCPSLFENQKISEFYLFLIFLDSNLDTFIYLSIVLSFLIWATEVPRKIQSLQTFQFLTGSAFICIRLFYYHQMWYSRGGIPHWDLVKSS